MFTKHKNFGLAKINDLKVFNLLIFLITFNNKLLLLNSGCNMYLNGYRPIMKETKVIN